MLWQIVSLGYPLAHTMYLGCSSDCRRVCCPPTQLPWRVHLHSHISYRFQAAKPCHAEQKNPALQGMNALHQKQFCPAAGSRVGKRSRMLPHLRWPPGTLHSWTLHMCSAGEYRTGKRISMRRVIGYIASHYRKDKIWMRRTRPDKRRYQVWASCP